MIIVTALVADFFPHAEQWAEHFNGSLSAPIVTSVALWKSLR